MECEEHHHHLAGGCRQVAKGLRRPKIQRSVSRWIGELLEQTRRRDDDYEIAMKRCLARRPRKFNWPDGHRPTREQLYGRSRIR